MMWSVAAAIIASAVGATILVIVLVIPSLFFPAPPQEPQKVQVSTPLSFAVFTFSSDEESMNIIRKHHSYNSSYDYDFGDNKKGPYVIQSIRALLHPDPSSSWLFEEFPDRKKMIIVQSLDNMTDAIELGNKFDNVSHMVYDIEEWDKTTRLEKEYPVIAISNGSHAVHAAGFKYGITPDAPTLLDNYRNINWTEIDFLGMQLQRFSDNTTEYSNYAREISEHVRSQNPEIEIFAQLSFRFTSTGDMITAIESAKDYVDGYIIAYLPDPDGDGIVDSCAATCTPEDLDQVLNTINALKSERISQERIIANAEAASDRIINSVS
jgi:hypothetical protein